MSDSSTASIASGAAVPAPRVDVLGVGVSAVNMGSALELVEQWVQRGHREYVCVTGVHGVMESQDDSALRGIHNASGLTLPDGMPMVWAGRFSGAQDMARVCGPDLVPALCQLAVERGWSSYFYGGAEGVPELLAQRLQQRHPGLIVAGCYSPPFRPLTADEEREVDDRINAANPTLVWVGLSTPKQERWMSAHRSRLSAPVLLGVGAAFDIHAGLTPQAPLWIQPTGLEWAYRLWREPRRLWRRYLTNNPRFLLKILRHRPRPMVS